MGNTPEGWTFTNANTMGWRSVADDVASALGKFRTTNGCTVPVVFTTPS